MIVELEGREGLRLDMHLLEELKKREVSAITRSKIQKLIRDGKVEINGVVVKKGGLKLKGKEKITVNFEFDENEEIEAENIPLDIIYEDNVILVVNKPAGMVVHPAAGHRKGTLVNAILYHVKDLDFPQGKVGLVHRLDKDTSGCLVVAKNEEALLELRRQWQNRAVEKEYVAVVEGHIPDGITVLKGPIGRHPKDRIKMAVVSYGKEAETWVEPIEYLKGATLCKVLIKTGRTHQIRVHLSRFGHPIVGDKVYGKGSNLINRVALHAKKLGFYHPITREWLEVEAPLADDIKSLINTLRQGN